MLSIALLSLTSPADAGVLVDLNISGSCPGIATLDVTGATPNGQVAFLTANVPGNAPYPGGPCVGVDGTLSGSGLKFRVLRTADGAGNVSLSPNLPEGVCGLFVAALDVSTCASSAATRLPTPPIVAVGARVEEGQVNPPTGSPAAGVLHAVLDGGSTLAWELAITDLANNLTNAHFHNAAVGQNGGIMQGIQNDIAQIGQDVRGSGSWNMSGADVAELAGERVYLNVHTNVFGGGEIRGQLVPVTRLSGIIDGDQQVPPVGSSAAGIATLSIDANDTVWWDVTIDDMTSTLTDAHFHGPAAGGANGGVVFGIGGEMIQSGTFVRGNGVWQPTAGELADLLAGNIYLNFHTDLFPGGEVRAQLFTD